jgi:hypothetical protein
VVNSCGMNPTLCRDINAQSTTSVEWNFEV